ncbi:MAG TPA: hypothetical protein VIY48_00980 [Candidatus Paceibacterota bacterium]
MRKSSGAGIATVVVGLLLALFVLIAVVACEGEDSGPAYYPHTSTYGYYDSHHHYHYYPQYQKGGKGYKVPAPKPGPKVNAPKSSGGGFKSGGSRRR